MLYLEWYTDLALRYSCRGNWYYTSKRCQKLFLLIMTRTISPCRITAGKIVTLSIENFNTVSVCVKNCIIIFKLSIFKNRKIYMISIIYITPNTIIKRLYNIGFLSSEGSKNDDVLFYDGTFLPVMTSYRSNHTYIINNTSLA